jgi:hypothetical protein
VRELTTNQKGAIAEMEIATAAMRLGIPVSRPLNDERYDFVFELSSGLVRVQCKWAVKDDEVVIIRCRRCRRGPEGLIRHAYKPGEIDAIAAYCPDTDACYFLPAMMSVNRAAVQLRLAPTRNNQSRLINWARDYEFGARLSDLGPIAQLGERDAGSVEAAGSSPAGSIEERLFEAV